MADITLLVMYRYYADIKHTMSASDQEMNSVLAELSRVRETALTFLSYVSTLVLDLSGAPVDY